MLRPLALVAALALSACASGNATNGWAAPRAPVAERGSAERVPQEASPPLEERPDAPQRSRTEPSAANSALGLIIPVAGIEAGQLRDTFTDPRSGGRTHNAIDIAAPTGTPILAATDGVVSRRHWHRNGGHTLYLTSADGRYDFYYAHLDTYAEGVEIGTAVRRGDLLGTVGSTGNARGPHLHLQILDRSGPGRGTPVNPYDLLRGDDLAAAD